jgi:hypothetical protein
MMRQTPNPPASSSGPCSGWPSALAGGDDENEQRRIASQTESLEPLRTKFCSGSFLLAAAEAHDRGGGPTKMARPKYITCAGCSQPFQGRAKDIWCDECLPTVKPLLVDMTDDQRLRVESLAVVRSTTPAEVMRQAVTILSSRASGRPLSAEEQAEAERPRPHAAKRKN